MEIESTLPAEIHDKYGHLIHSSCDGLYGISYRDRKYIFNIGETREQALEHAARLDDRIMEIIFASHLHKKLREYNIKDGTSDI